MQAESPAEAHGHPACESMTSPGGFRIALPSRSATVSTAITDAQKRNHEHLDDISTGWNRSVGPRVIRGATGDETHTIASSSPNHATVEATNALAPKGSRTLCAHSYVRSARTQRPMARTKRNADHDQGEDAVGMFAINP